MRILPRLTAGDLRWVCSGKTGGVLLARLTRMGSLNRVGIDLDRVGIDMTALAGLTGMGSLDRVGVNMTVAFLNSRVTPLRIS